MRRPLQRLAVMAVAMALPVLAAGRLDAQDAEAGRSFQLRINDALVQYKSLGFAAATRGLQAALDLCQAGTPGDYCRGQVKYSLGYVYQTEASTGSEAADTLLRRAVDYYDEALAADQENWAARYNKALLYRATGAQASHAAYFREAARADPARRATYLSLLGDHYLERQLPDSAARAYRESLAVAPGDAGARGGLIEAYRALGASGLRPLFEQAEQWRLTFESSAEEAYAVLLEEAITAGDRTMTDTACIRLVALQEHITGPFLTLRPDIPSVRTWAPAQQVDSFMTAPAQAAVPWWQRGIERRNALAHATLVRGNAAASEGKAADAERFYAAGIRLAEERSTEAVDLQRELALLYMRNPALDPDGAKFDRLQDGMFRQKEVVLASRDLEAAQRFHTTLGLIYAERGTWVPGLPYRNAVQQLSMAVRAVEARTREEGFFQPLPEVRSLLAYGLAKAGQQRGAQEMAISAARAGLDVDDAAAADSMVTVARGYGAADVQLDRLAALASLRSILGTGQALRGAEVAPADKAARCTGEVAAAASGTGTTDFERRQRFKILGDCSQLTGVTDWPDLALAGFAAADTAGFTLVGAPDVRRLQLTLDRLGRLAGGPSSIGRPRARIVTAPVAGAPSIIVSLRNQTEPRWLAVPADDLILARVLGVLVPAGARVLVEVRDGDVVIRGSVPPTLMRQLQRVPGLASVRFEP